MNAYRTTLVLLLVLGGCASARPCQTASVEDVAVLQAATDGTVLSDEAWTQVRSILLSSVLGVPQFPQTQDEVEAWKRIGERAPATGSESGFVQPERVAGRDLVFPGGVTLLEEIALSSEARGGKVCLDAPLAVGTGRSAAAASIDAGWQGSFDGAVFFSAPGYDQSHTVAAVVIGRALRSGEGSRYLVILAREKAGWIVKNRVPAAVF